MTFWSNDGLRRINDRFWSFDETAPSPVYPIEDNHPETERISNDIPEVAFISRKKREAEPFFFDFDFLNPFKSDNTDGGILGFGNPLNDFPIALGNDFPIAGGRNYDYDYGYDDDDFGSSSGGFSDSNTFGGGFDDSFTYSDSGSDFGSDSGSSSGGGFTSVFK